MWYNIGRKLQGLAKFLCWIGIICSVIAAVIFWSQDARFGPTLLLGFVCLIPGVLISWISSWAIYGLGLVVEHVENGGSAGNQTSDALAHNVVRAIKQSEEVEKQKLETAQRELKEKEQKQQERNQRIEQLRSMRANGELVEEDDFLKEIAGETSMMTIWQIWKQHNLAERNPEADEFIRKYKDMERMYGKSNNIDEIKKELKGILSPDTVSGQTQEEEKGYIIDNPDWIDDGDGFVRCPTCNKRMSLDFIRARRKCPDCGREYL